MDIAMALRAQLLVNHTEAILFAKLLELTVTLRAMTTMFLDDILSSPLQVPPTNGSSSSSSSGSSSSRSSVSENSPLQPSHIDHQQESQQLQQLDLNTQQLQQQQQQQQQQQIQQTVPQQLHEQHQQLQLGQSVVGGGEQVSLMDISHHYLPQTHRHSPSTNGHNTHNSIEVTRQYIRLSDVANQDITTNGRENYRL